VSLTGAQGELHLSSPIAKGNTLTLDFHSELLMARTYAICNQNRVVLAVLVTLAMGTIISELVWNYIHLKATTSDMLDFTACGNR
jgi:hypothetical protein